MVFGADAADKASVMTNARQKMWLVAIAVFIAGDSAAWAGLPHWRRRVPYPSDTYAPETRHYTVIDPVVVNAPKRKHSLNKYATPPGQVLWRQQVEAAPTYPWGWFGARRHVDNTGHVRYYANERDWSYLRGD